MKYLNIPSPSVGMLYYWTINHSSRPNPNDPDDIGVDLGRNMTISILFTDVNLAQESLRRALISTLDTALSDESKKDVLEEYDAPSLVELDLWYAREVFERFGLGLYSLTSTSNTYSRINLDEY